VPSWSVDRIFMEYARVYLERDHKLLNEALKMFQKMGAKWQIRKIIARKKLLTA
jgi:hypothetical protein